MVMEDDLLQVFYLIDNQIKALDLPRLRQRGPRPTLVDSQVLTLELAGEFLGIDTDKGIYRFFRHDHHREFPGLLRVGRTAFVRQASGGSSSCRRHACWPCCP